MQISIALLASVNEQAAGSDRDLMNIMCFQAAFLKKDHHTVIIKYILPDFHLHKNENSFYHC